MTNRAKEPLLVPLRKMFAAEQYKQLGDEQLLQCFVAEREEGAFAALVKRHGPMVMSVCQAVLRHTQDAEDACQASFLMLARKSGSIRKKTSVASWLHRVAYRMATKLAATKKQNQQPLADQAISSPEDDLSWREVRQIVHEELERLPQKYRQPLILCYLEGQTQEEAAKQLGWTGGALKGMLTRGRDLLKRRLTVRGLGTAAPLLAAPLAREAMAHGLVKATAHAAVLMLSGKTLSAGISVQAAGLVKEGLKGMLLTKLTVGAAVVLMVGALAGGMGWAAFQATAGSKPATTQKDDKKVAALPQVQQGEEKKKELSRADLLGDALPSGVITRIGTVRFLQHADSRALSPPAYTPDCMTLVSCDGKAVRFFEGATGKPLRQIHAGNNDKTTFKAFALSPDGKTVVTASNFPFTIQVWDAATCKELAHFEWTRMQNDAVTLVFTQDGKTFAAPDNGVRFWDLASLKEKQHLESKSVSSFVISPDGKTLITIGYDGMYWWEIASGREIRRVDISKLGNLPRLVLSADGKRLALWARYKGKGFERDNLLHLWNGVTGEEICQTLLDTKGSYWEISFSPDSQTLIASGQLIGNSTDRRRTLFLAADTGKELRRRESADDFFSRHWGFSPDGKTIAKTMGGVIELYDFTTSKPTVAVSRLPDSVSAIGFAADAKTLLVGFKSGHFGSWEVNTGKPVGSLKAPPQGFGKSAENLCTTAMTADGKRVAVLNSRDSLLIWEPATGKTLGRIKAAENVEDPAIFSPDGRTLLVTQSNNLVLWDVATAKVVHRFPLAATPSKFDWSQARAFSTDGRILATDASSQDERSIRLWDTVTGKEAGKLTWNDGTSPASLIFSADGKRLVVTHTFNYPFGPKAKVGPKGKAEEQSSWRIWDLESQRELRRFPGKPPLHGHEMVMSPDDKTLATGQAGDIILWELATGKERGRFAGHFAGIWSLAFSSDGRLLASGSADQTALVWDVTGISPDGKWEGHDLSALQLKSLWAELGETDGVKAYRAMWTMAAARQSVPFLAERLKPVAVVADVRIAQLLADLDSDQFKVRSAATAELKQLGDLAEPAMRKVLAANPALELRQRLQTLLEASAQWPQTAEQLQLFRSIEVLENVGTFQAGRLLQALANGAEGARLTMEAKASIQRLARRKAQAR